MGKPAKMLGLETDYDHQQLTPYAMHFQKWENELESELEHCRLTSSKKRSPPQLVVPSELLWKKELDLELNDHRRKYSTNKELWKRELELELNDQRKRYSTKEKDLWKRELELELNLQRKRYGKIKAQFSSSKLSE